MKRIKNILHVIESSDTGGAECIFLEIILGQLETFNHFAVLFKHGWLEEQLLNNNIKYIVLSSGKSYDLSLVFRMVKVIKSFNIDLIHSHLLGSNVYSSISGYICNVPVISTFHGVVDVSNDDKMSWLKFYILNKFSTKIVFVSNYLVNVFKDRYNVNLCKSMVIYNGTDVKQIIDRDGTRETFRKKLGCVEDTCLVVSVGDMRRVKGYNILIAAAGKLIGKGNFKFAVAGTVTKLLGEYMVEIKKEGLEDHFVFLGYLDNVKPLLHSGDVFVLPSLSEGFSIATIEAMSAGLPVVVTASGGPEEIINHGYNGIVVPVASVDSICEAIIKLSRRNSDVEQITANALHEVKKKFSMGKMLSMYSDLYNELI